MAADGFAAAPPARQPHDVLGPPPRRPPHPIVKAPQAHHRRDRSLNRPPREQPLRHGGRQHRRLSVPSRRRRQSPQPRYGDLSSDGETAGQLSAALEAPCAEPRLLTETRQGLSAPDPVALRLPRYPADRP